MLFLIVGIALVLMEAAVLMLGNAGATRHVDKLGWEEMLLPFVVFAVGAWRWPREWIAVLLFAVALVANQVAGHVPLGRMPTLVALGIGVYLAIYGWRTRKIDRGESKGLRQFALWFVIVVGLGWFLLFRG